MDLQGRNPVIYLDHSGPVTFPQDTQSNLQNFKKREPVILGVSQIMVGLMSICLWIILKVSFLFHDSLPVILRHTILPYFLLVGPIFFILSGALSIVSGKKMTKTMICSSLGMNTVSTILAVVTLTIPALYLDSTRWISDTVVQSLMRVIMIIKIILMVLEIFITLSLSAFACNAICCEETSVVVDLSSKELELCIHSPYHDYDEVAFPPT